MRSCSDVIGPSLVTSYGEGVTSDVLLSVVVPVYNAQNELPECLDSILSQDLGNVEVIVVNDGSTDASEEVARDYAGRHPAVRVLASANQGPGLARNLGVERSSGEFLAFADADDVIPPGAYRLMLETLAESGSDFAVGSVRRDVDGRVFEPPFLRHAHRRRRIGIRIDDLPEVMRNVFAWSKVFRRSFWNEAHLRFPPGRMGEDQAAMTEAFLRAAAFDVLPQPVYVWRTKTGSSSVSQQRHRVADLKDRIATKLLTAGVISQLASPRVRQYWTRHGLGGDLPLYFRHLPTCDDEYWRTLVLGVQQLFPDQRAITQSLVLRVQYRLVGWLVLHDRRAEAVAVMKWVEQHPGPLPLRVEDDHVAAQLPHCDDPASGIPAELFWLADHELIFDSRLLAVQLTDQRIQLNGFAVIRGAPTSGVTCRIDVVLRSDLGDRLTLQVQPRPSPAATQWVGRLPQRYDDGAFEAWLNPAVLRAWAAGHVEGPIENCKRWEVELSVTVGGVRRTGRFLSRAADAGLPLTIAGNPRLVARFNQERGLVIEVAD
jgi:Glycosyl transferase family 2